MYLGSVHRTAMNGFHVVSRELLIVAENWKPQSGQERNGRGDWIRTSDPLRPRQVRYQAALRPDSLIIA